MPSLKCYQCGKVKRCQMFESDARPEMGIAKMIVYLCRTCAKELGHEAHDS